MKPEGEIQTARYKLRIWKNYKQKDVIFITKEDGEGFETTIENLDNYLDEFFDENM